jgi:hypothetical protein
MWLPSTSLGRWVGSQFAAELSTEIVARLRSLSKHGMAFAVACGVRRCGRREEPNRYVLSVVAKLFGWGT